MKANEFRSLSADELRARGAELRSELAATDARRAEQETAEAEQAVREAEERREKLSRKEQKAREKADQAERIAEREREEAIIAERREREAGGAGAKLLESYKAKYGKAPDGNFPLYGVAAMQVILAGIAKSDGTRKGVNDAVLTGEGVSVPASESVLGKEIKIDPTTGDTTTRGTSNASQRLVNSATTPPPRLPKSNESQAVITRSAAPSARSSWVCSAVTVAPVASRPPKASTAKRVPSKRGASSPMRAA